MHCYLCVCACVWCVCVCACVCVCVCVWTYSSAQLLEPFRHSHDIQLISGGTGIMSGGVGVGDLDRAPGAPTAGMMQSNLSVGTTIDLEDPPGLYEKVATISFYFGIVYGSK